MKYRLWGLVLCWSVIISAQQFQGEVMIKEGAHTYFNPVYVTNLTTQKTQLSGYRGQFSVAAQLGDVVRFTSLSTERKDVKVTAEMLQSQHNIIALEWAYKEIAEVRISKFKPSGILKKDILALENPHSALEIKRKLNLPEPKGESLPDAPVALAGGGLSFNLSTIYDMISGEQQKKQRLQAYEKMLNTTSAIRKYYGDAYFINQKIPQHYIDDFLQFVYTSERLSPLVEQGRYEVAKVYFEKYFPVYRQRLKNNHLMDADQNEKETP
ncbi:hypothetical protein [Riemerella columbina]|uniref:hypothetical protein n=1 Tax=Riemerella columbina TaxID=103810 RepID=UPI00266F1794|nr:hypothetical protein [Riemerella columbina]WKS94775.1 hypothetical protein NYR17_07540 [Riemerella columbina]